MTLCRNPYTQGMHVYGCGRCMPCRIQRRRIWEHRITLETSLKSDNSFCTLTYRSEDMPLNGTGLPTLEPRHLQTWLKRLRATWLNECARILRMDRHQLKSAPHSPSSLRFYAVGEYGDQTFRPHYHVALFGYPTCSRLGMVVRSGGCTCPSCVMVRDTWGHGNIQLGTLEPASARYLAGYIEKKMTRNDDPRLEGRHPEFSRMSLRPGIGADMIDEVASSLMQFNLEDSAEGDVPSSLRHGTRVMPLGRYLTRRLRTRVGKEANAPPQDPNSERSQKMRALLQRAFTDKENVSLKSQVVLENTPKALNQATLSKIRKQKRHL